MLIILLPALYAALPGWALALLAGLALAALAAARRPSGGLAHVTVLVLGDLGRSPRMQYHALSLAAHRRVSVVAYGGSPPLPALAAHPHVTLHLLRAPPALPPGLPRLCFLLYAPVKVGVQLAQLLWLLGVWVPTPAAVLVQNPPAIPALPAAWLAARLRGARLVVDWHNYGCDVLRLTLRVPAGRRHWLLRLAAALEFGVGRRADAHLCVTHAMRADLLRDPARLGPGVPPAAVTVLHDRPAAMFAATTPAAAHALCLRLGGVFLPAETTPETGETTLLTTTVSQPGGAVQWRPAAERPALVVSSTSWTEDEDFGLLLAALTAYDAAAAADRALPPLVVAVTGKGPRRAWFEAAAAAAGWRRVRAVTLWLAPGDYPLLLGCADLGVSLHVSASGLDLPMKVVDMFGCGLPVCAAAFACLGELVHDGVDGRVFADAPALAAQLQALLRHPRAQLAAFRAALAPFRATPWQANWDACARAVLLGAD
jgi:beta-1,4-mannosyltransferase